MSSAYENIRQCDAGSKCLGDCDGTVAAPGATNPDVEVGLSLESVSGNKERQKVCVFIQKLSRIVRFNHKCRNLGLKASLWLQLLDKIRVPQETNVDNEIAVSRCSIFKAE
jgi:hypothetical protein